MWQTPIDIYCERLDASLWAEPLNAVTNLSFVIAAWWAWHSHRRDGLKDLRYQGLCHLAAAIGVGSLLFHTFANTWSQYADIIPIWSFVILFVIACLRWVFEYEVVRVARASVIALILAGVGFYLANQSGNEVPAFNGSIQYAPALLFMLILCVALRLKRPELMPVALAATGLFFMSLVFRSIDLMLCPAFPMGTHFLWHLLNGVMIFWLLRLLHLGLMSRRPKL